MSDEDIFDDAPYTIDDDWDSYDPYEELLIRRAVERSFAAVPDNQGLSPERPLLTVS
jgi:hypothetical protein